MSTTRNSRNMSRRPTPRGLDSEASPTKRIAQYEEKIRELQICGKEDIIWDGKDFNNNIVSSGIYLLKIETTHNNTFLKKIIKIK